VAQLSPPWGHLAQQDRKLPNIGGFCLRDPAFLVAFVGPILRFASMTTWPLSGDRPRRPTSVAQDHGDKQRRS